MPSPKSGKAGSVVSPTDPQNAQEADQADPGEVAQVKAEQQQTQSGKYGSAKTEPHKPPQTKEDAAKKKSWIEVEILREDDSPVTGEQYKITLPDGTIADGTTDDKGLVRVSGIDPGQCKIQFPNLDGKGSERA